MLVGKIFQYFIALKKIRCLLQDGYRLKLLFILCLL